MPSKDAKKGVFQEIIRPTLVLISICVVVAGLLAFTYDAAGIKALEAAGLSEKQLAEALPEVLPEGTLLTKAETSYEDPDFLGLYRDEGGAGCALFVKAKGYGGAIKLLVGFSPDGAVTGVRTMENAETPGLGTRALTGDYLAQYIGRSGEVAVKADGGDIDAIAGSTISSKAVVRGVNAAMAAYEQVKGELQ